MRTRRLLGIVARANRLRPDLIVLTGDYMGGKLVDWPRSWLEEALPPLAGLHAPLGVFAVSGNHDSLFWLNRIMGQQLRPRLLRNENVDVGPLVVAGLVSIEQGVKFGRTLAGIPPGKPILLLRHEADYLIYTNAPPDNPVLVLAGHTHGGQVVLPLLGSIGNRFYSHTLCRRGLCDIHGWRVFVSSGLGTSVLPLRFGVPPELALITLYGPE
jgi:predicted MPP superfamily phosphohydrolase